MDDADFRAYISERYRDGEVTTDDWFETDNLFDAAIDWAWQNKDDPKMRREALEIALDAAAQSLDLDFHNCAISREVERQFDDIGEDVLRNEEGWFCDRIIDLYKSKLGDNDYENALTLYNIGEVLKAKGEMKLAAEAFASSHSLSPKDPIPTYVLKDVQVKMGDWLGVLATVKEMGWDITEVSDREYNDRLRELAYLAGDAGEAYLNLGMFGDAEISLMLALRGKYLFVAKKTEKGDPDYINKVAGEINKWTTSLGLVALAVGDRERAIKWFKESFVHSQHMAFKGYDLRLLKELMKDPSLRKLCISYLQLALEAKMTGMEEEVKALLAKLTSNGTETRASGTFGSGKGATTEPDESTAMRPVAEPTQPEHASSDEANTKRTRTTSASAIVIIIILSAYMVRKRRKRKKEQE